MKPCRIILADDHVIFRQGMKQLIHEVPNLKVVAEANDGVELLDLLKNKTADILLLDISMPGIRGIEATREINRQHPEIHILILTMHKNKEYLYHVISEGAKGYLLKEDSDVELISAIETIRTGGIYITKLLAPELVDDLSKIKNGKYRYDQGPLSNRERIILKFIAEGKSNKEIADILTISKRTVETHRANMMRKLGLSNTADIVKYAIQIGLTDLNN